MNSVHIHSFAKALGDRLVTNEDLAKIISTSDEWITQRTGIRQRYWSSPDQPTSVLATTAARKSLELANNPQIDCVIAATLSPDFNFPGIAVQVQAALGLNHVPAYDLRNQCAGFLYALEMGRALILAGQYERVLVIGAEVHSTGLDISDRGRDIAVLFGDGAGSCILEKSTAAEQRANQSQPRFQLLATKLHADGNFAKELWCEHPGSAHFPTRLTDELVAEGRCFPTMNGRKVFEHAVKQMVAVSADILKSNAITPQDISHFLPHQANLRINQMVADTLGIKPEAAFSTIQKYGNTTAATIPIGFSDAVAECEFKSGEFVLSAAFGSGFVWGAALYKVV